jgi:cell division protein FtsB
MKLASAVIAGLTAITVYLSLQLVFGSYGVIAHSVVSEYLDRSEEALEVAVQRRNDLQREIASLTADRETIRVEARRIGFVAPDETLVRVAGRDRHTAFRYALGSLPADVPIPRDNRPLFRSIALAAALIVLIVAFLRAPEDTPRPGRRDEEWEIEVDGK